MGPLDRTPKTTDQGDQQASQTLGQEIYGDIKAFGSLAYHKASDTMSDILSHLALDMRTDEQKQKDAIRLAGCFDRLPDHHKQQLASNVLELNQMRKLG